MDGAMARLQSRAGEDYTSSGGSSSGSSHAPVDRKGSSEASGSLAESRALEALRSP